MARAAPLHAALRRPIRSSLAHIGIPDSRDGFAVYLWWTKQQRQRAFTEMTVMASSVLSVRDANEVQVPLSPAVQTAFETRSLSRDLFGVGGQFE